MYPDDLMKKTNHLREYPKCIFKPSVFVLRKMIESIVSKPEDMSFEDFMLKFGLLDKADQYLQTEKTFRM